MILFSSIPQLYSNRQKERDKKAIGMLRYTSEPNVFASFHFHVTHRLRAPYSQTHDRSVISVPVVALHGSRRCLTARPCCFVLRLGAAFQPNTKSRPKQQQNRDLPIQVKNTWNCNILTLKYLPVREWHVSFGIYSKQVAFQSTTPPSERVPQKAKRRGEDPARASECTVTPRDSAVPPRQKYAG